MTHGERTPSAAIIRFYWGASLAVLAGCASGDGHGNPGIDDSFTWDATDHGYVSRACDGRRRRLLDARRESDATVRMTSRALSRRSRAEPSRRCIESRA
jgi:hypothetical protein